MKEIIPFVQFDLGKLKTLKNWKLVIMIKQKNKNNIFYFYISLVEIHLLFRAFYHLILSLSCYEMIDTLNSVYK